MRVVAITVSLIVENDVGPPDLVWWNSDELDPVKLSWNPPELVIIPNLRERQWENSVSILKSQPSVLCFALYTANSLSHQGLPPPFIGTIWNTYLYCRQSFLWCFTVEPNKDIVAKNLIFIEHLGAFIAFFTENQAHRSMFWMQFPLALKPQSFSKQIRHLQSHLYVVEFREKGSMWANSSQTGIKDECVYLLFCQHTSGWHFMSCGSISLGYLHVIQDELIH